MCGRPARSRFKTHNYSEGRAIFRLFSKNPQLSLRKGQAVLARRSINNDIMMTLRRRLQENNIAWRSTMAKPLLSRKHVENRLTWAHSNIDRNWSDIVFSDEASFWAWSPIKHAWSIHGNSVIERTVKHPLKVNVWGCFNARGLGTLCVFTGILNAQRMIKLYQRGLLTSRKRWFIQPGDRWLLHEDNDPKHRSRVCTEWKARNDIMVLPWPSQSPDANAIENVFVLL